MNRGGPSSPRAGASPGKFSPARVTPPATASARRNARSGRAPSTDAARPAAARLDESLLDTVRSLINRYELRSGEPIPAKLAVTSVGPGTGSGEVARAFAHVLANELAATTCLAHLGWLAPDGRADQRAAAVDGPTVVPVDGTPLLSELQFGPVPANQRNAFVRSAEFSELLGGLRDKFERVVYDLPSVLHSPGALAVMVHADAAILVVRHRSTPLAQVEQVRTAIDPTPTLAVVVNRFRPSIPRPLRRLFGG